MTAVELLPVHHIADEAFLADRGLTNYWGYSTIGFLAPHSPYAATGKAGQEVREFKGMVKALHKAGIEVILDVVYNHTAEGNHLGPMLSFRGVDNAAYYRLVPDDPRHYMDYTGTGNTLNVMHPSVLRLIMDSLRYWVIDCHVDGFRFDLASALARELYDVDRLSRVLRRHPSGPGAVPGQADRRAVGRRPGRLPGRQLPRAVVGVERHLPRHDARLLARRGARRRVRAAAHRLERPLPGRRPPPVRLDQLHHRPRRLPAAPTSSPTTRSTTRPTRRATATGPTTTGPGTAASRGRPTIPRSSRCAPASSATSWPRCCSPRARRCCSAATSSGARRAATTTAGARTPRSPGSTGRCWRATPTLLEFTRKLIALRRAHAVFRRRQFLFGREVEGSGLPDAAWFRADGERMRDEDWGGVDAGRRRVPQRRGDRLARLARAPGARRVVPAAVQRATTRTARSRCRTARSARRGRWCFDTARPDARAGRRELAGGCRARAGPPLAGAAAPRPE